MSFTLDRRLAGDTIPVGDLELTRVLLMDDARWPWLILTPRRENIVEIFDLDAADRASLTEETAATARIIAGVPATEKVNVGALGNIVRQFHMHIVGRRTGDPAWPGPVWGVGTRRRYESDVIGALRSEFALKFGLCGLPFQPIGDAAAP